MKNLFIFLIAFIATQAFVKGNGVAIVDGSQNVYMSLLESNIDVQIQNQVATTTTTQWFRNNQLTDTTIKYAFPLHEEASAIKLRWLLDGIWYTASFSAQPQDTTLPGNGPSNELLNYLGNNPFYFDLETLIPRDSVFAIELTYVELLPYQLSRVDYVYPNDYSLIQSLPVLSQEFNLSIQSQRKIETLDMTSHPGATIINNDYDATLTWEL
ncbi:MAG: hypothetical protein KDD63_23405, partial [Bacteroidetes bacterium]|nr:hypothetical protein [Bacteroidota bacterium]